MGAGFTFAARARWTTWLGLGVLACVGCNRLLGLRDGVLSSGPCEPLAVVACYTGPAGTEGVGACHAGVMRCNADGDAYGPCEGEVTPAPELCSTSVDEDCDGSVDEPDAGCSCAPGAVEACAYTGPAGTEGVGVCHAGARTCTKDGQWGPCAGEVRPGVEDCTTAADEGCDGAEDCGAVVSGGLLGGDGPQAARAIAADPAGGVVVGGEFSGRLDLGDGRVASSAQQDVFVARFVEGGAASWVARLVDRGAGRLSGVAVDPLGAVAVVGELQGEIRSAGLAAATDGGFVVKLDPLGAVAWGALVDGLPRGVATTATGDIVVVSALSDAVQGGEVSVSAYGATGMPLWHKVFGGPGEQTPTAVATDSGGRAVLIGSFEGTMDLGPGKAQLTSAGMRDVFLIRLDKHGDVVDGLSFGDGRDQRGGSVTVGPSDEIALTGAFEGTLDVGGQLLFAQGTSVFVAELASGGKTGFGRAMHADTSPTLAIDALGNVLLTGEVQGDIDLGGGPLRGAVGALDVYAAKLDPAGHHLWSRRLGGATGARHAAGVAATAGGEVALAATVEGDVNLGGKGPVQANAGDVLLVRLAP